MTVRRQQHTATVRLHAPLVGARLADPAAPLPTVVAVTPSSLLPTGGPPMPPEATHGAGHSETDAGLRAGKERDMIERTLQAITEAFAEERGRREAERAEWKRAAVELGVAIASRILHERISTNAFPVEAIVREVIGQAAPGPLMVHLHPADLDLLHARLDDKPLIEDPERISLLADPSLGRGDCRVEGKDSLVLSHLPTQLEEVRRHLLRSLGHAYV